MEKIPRLCYKSQLFVHHLLVVQIYRVFSTKLKNQLRNVEPKLNRVIIIINSLLFSISCKTYTRPCPCYYTLNGSRSIFILYVTVCIFFILLSPKSFFKFLKRLPWTTYDFQSGRKKTNWMNRNMGSSLDAWNHFFFGPNLNDLENVVVLLWCLNWCAIYANEF